MTVFDIKDEMAMSLTSSIANPQSPNFYAEMGELIASSGQTDFAAHMLHLVDKWVPIHLVDLSEWTLDELRDRVRGRYPEAELAFEHVRTLTDQREITRWIAALQLQAQG